MGLQEKRFKATLQEEVIPYWMRFMQETIEKNIPIEVDWDSFGNRSFNDLQYVQTTGVEYVATSLREIARRDSLGKSAIQAFINKVVLRQEDNAGLKKITVENGVLEMHCDWRESSRGWFLEHEIIDIVESLL